MTTYYVRKTGSDAAAGTSPGAAWLTIGKALGAAGIASGDTVYVGAGVYREVVTVAMTSATAETKIIADVDGSQTGDPGEVRWTAFLTNDKTAPTNTATLNLGGRDFLTFERFVFVSCSAGTNPATVDAKTTVTPTNITFRYCTFLSTSNSGDHIWWLNTAAGEQAHWLIDSCIFQTYYNRYGFRIQPNTHATTDYDVDVVVRNCLFIGGLGIFCQPQSALTGKPGGLLAYNNTFLSGINSFTVAANGSTSIPCAIYNSVILGSSSGPNAATSGQILEDYNYIQAATPHTNVTVGTNSKTNDAYSPLLQVGQEIFQGKALRPFLSPSIDSPLLGFGNQAGGPTVDLLGLTRPSGSGPTWANILPSVGAYERGDTGAKETTTVRTSVNALKIVGPGSQDFQLAVDAVSTTVTVYGRFDTNHAVTNRPQMKVLNGTEAGVADATATMTAAVDTWEQLSLNFTPTAKGIVTIRLVSRAAAGNGIAFFDDFAVQ